MIEFIDIPSKASFSAAVLHDDEDHDLPDYAYPGAVPEAWVPGVSVRISPSYAGDWIGHFSRGMESVNGIDLCCCHPDGERVVVVSRGSGYIVSADAPSEWEEISIHPILGYVFDLDSNTLVFFDFIRATGIGESGLLWQSKPLSWDGLTAVEAKNGFLTGQGWDAAQSKFVRFEVNLIDGTHSGGATSPEINR